MENIFENFRFLVIEAENQVRLTYGLLSNYRPETLEKIASKDDYIDNLKTSLENDCFSRMQSLGGNENVERRNQVRAIHIMAVNLERIADYCVNMGRQTHYLSSMEFFQQYDYKSMFSEIQRALSSVSEVFENRDLAAALAICRSEFNLDRQYKENFDQIMAELKQGHDVPDLVTTIFIFRYLERIGDALLNIGEALIFAIVGDRIKIRQFDALQQTLSDSGFEGALSDIDFHSIWGSRSGCRISKVSRKRPSGFKAQGIFKEGALKKIKQERENIDRWSQLFPGLAPQVFGYHEKGGTASMLVEFLSGCTLDQVILTEPIEVIRNVLYILEQTLHDIWDRTRKNGPFPTDYMRQLRSRLSSVYRVHPYFNRPRQEIGGRGIPASMALIEACETAEAELPAPYAVLIHGDFNTNNIVYNGAEQRINYIDLYRSRDADYVQDASVLLVSHFRLPVFDAQLRERLNAATHFLLNRFRELAAEHDDPTFDARMGLALARSFYTSTRFELNFAFAREMYLRSIYLMESVAAHRGRPWAAYRLPDRALLY
jgi:phosphate uptake regulator